jgi:hypothetical protein
MTSICCELEGAGSFDVEQSAMTIRIDGRPVINDFIPQAADGGQLDGNDLRAAMKIVYEHMHRIQPTDRDTLLRALDTLEIGYKNENWTIYVP